MSVDENEEEKRQLQKLFREYDSNIGMAGLVCGRPVELMPEAEQDRLISGFCTPGNLKILSVSKDKLTRAKSLHLTESERGKIDAAIPTLSELLDAFSSYSNSSLDKNELRKRVRQALDKPIPEEQDALEHALSHQIETLDFLTSQRFDQKDAWDRMVDYVQLHDALVRTQKVSKALMACVGSVTAGSSAAIESTVDVAQSSIEFLESFFKKGEENDALQAHIDTLSSTLHDLWGE